MGKWIFSVIIGTVLFLLSGCSWADGEAVSENSQVFDYGGSQTLRILSGSENRELEQILDDFAREEHINIVMEYQGSLDIMRALESGTTDYDAVWPASSMWISAGDTSHRVKHSASISITPVVFGIRQSLAEELGFVGQEVSVSDILSAVSDGKLEFCMTSATQSNSGCCAYIGFFICPFGKPGYDHLRSPFRSGSDQCNDRAAVWCGPFLRQLRLAEGYVFIRGL